MRILLSTYGSRGDTEPMVALAVALKALGAEAMLSAPADQEFVDLAERTGVELAPAFMPVREWIAWARQSGLGIPGFAKVMVPKQYEAIGAAAAGCDAIVATGLFPSVAAAQCVAEEKRLAFEHVAYCPLFVPSHHHKPFPRPGAQIPSDMTDPAQLWALNAQHMNEIFAEPINSQRASAGLPALDNVRDQVCTDHQFLASDPVLWPWEPTELSHPVQTGAWILADGRPLPADLESFLGAGDPPVYVGFGSIAVQGAQEIAQGSVKAIRAQGRRAVLARGWADMALVDGQNDCFLIGEVNQQALFKRCAVVVHHGGAGTTTTAARAGAPQIIVPQIVDQPYWADRVAGLGIGVAHDGPTPTFESLSAALTTALTPETIARAKAVAGAIRTDGAMVAARMLLERAG